MTPAAWGWIAALALMLASAIMMAASASGYRASGPSALGPEPFADNLADWPRREGAIESMGEGTVRLANAEPSRIVVLARPLAPPAAGGHLRLRAEIKTVDLVPGASERDRARLMLGSYDALGAPLAHHPHIAAAIGESRDWSRVSAVFPIGGDVHELRLILQLAHATGEFYVRHLTLEPVAPTPLYRGLRIALLVAWCGYGLWLATRFAPWRAPRRAHAAVVLAAALILLGTLAPKAEQARAENWLLAQWQGDEPAQARARAAEAMLMPPAISPLLARPPSALEGLTLGKIGHLAGFGLLGLALALARPSGRPALLVAGLALAAGASELLQDFTPGRDALWRDGGLDFAGGLAGLALGRIASRSARRARGRASNGEDAPR